MDRVRWSSRAGVIILAALSCFAVSAGQPGAIDDLPSTAASVATAKSRLDGQLAEVEAILRNTDKVVAGDFAQCEGLYRYLTEQFSLAPRGTIEAAQHLSRDVEQLLEAVGPIADAQAELEAREARLQELAQDVNRQESELARLQRSAEDMQERLSALQQQQGEAILAWLLDHEGQAFHSDQIVVGSYQITIVRSMLFGTFAVSYPRELGAGEVGEIRVTYMPTLFAGDDLTPQHLEIGPTETSIDLSGVAIELTPGRVSGGAQAGFKMGELIAVDKAKPTSWSWRVTAGEAFQGVAFEIVMSAARIDGPNRRHEAEVAGLKVSIKRRGEPGWWQWFTDKVLNGWVIAGFTIVITEVVRDGIPWWWRRRKEKRVRGFAGK